MSKKVQIRNSCALREASGQSIVEGTAFMVMLTMLATGMIIFMLNLARLSSYNYRLQVIASEAAKQVIANAYWMEMTRSGFTLRGGATNPSSSSVDIGENCAYLVNKELKMLGLPEASNFRIESRNEKVLGNDIMVVNVDFEVSGLTLESAGLFKPIISLHAHGVATSAQYRVSPHGICLIHCVDDSVKPPIERAIRVPVYNATIGSDTPADNSYLRAGDSIGQTACAGVTIYCENDGLLNLPSGTKNWGPWPNKLQ